MKKTVFCTLLCTLLFLGASITYGAKLDYYDYKILFTNPVCGPYWYGDDQKVFSVSGDRIDHKPENVFCNYGDAEVSGARSSSPQNKLIKWIRNKKTREIFMAYLSFSNRPVATALCEAIEERSMKLTVLLDQTTNTTRASEVLKCRPANGKKSHRPRLILRGHEGGIGYAHNKIFIVNPDSEKTVKLAFSSGNMSSGAVLHHENWHFITLPAETYFAQLHTRCLRNGIVDADHSSSRKKYGRFISGCRADLVAEGYEEESDIKVFFVPGEGEQDAFKNYLVPAIQNAATIDIAAHRFSYNKLIDALWNRLSGKHSVDVRLVADDDTYWAAHGSQVGDNGAHEYRAIERLWNKGLEVRFMETNHASHLLHHNKYLIFDFEAGSDLDSAVFAGAGNLTGTAFRSNFENFYYITIPDVVTEFQNQYEYMWNVLATAEEDLPDEDVFPSGGLEE